MTNLPIMSLFSLIQFKNYSLRQLTKQTLRESVLRNKQLKQNQWGLTEQLLINCSNRIVRSLAMLSFLLFTLGLVIAHSLIASRYPMIQGFLDEAIDPRYLELIITTQVAITGAVFPIALAVLSLLFKNKLTEQLYLKLFFDYSAFLFSTFSGLLFVLFGGSAMVFWEIISPTNHIAIRVISYCWLSTNLFLTAWLFLSVFRMLDEESRLEIISKHTLSSLYKLISESRLPEILLMNGEKNLKQLNRGGPVKIEWSPIGTNGYEGGVLKHKKPGSRLSNISFVFIKLAISSIQKRHEIDGIEKKVNFYPQYESRNNVWHIASPTNVTITRIEKWLIKIAFRFKNKGISIKYEQVIEAITCGALDALKSDNEALFSREIQSIARWHSNVVKSYSYRTKDGIQENMLQLASEQLGLKSFLDTFHEAYISIQKAALSKSPLKRTYISTLFNLPRWIYWEISEYVSEKELELLLSENRWLFVQLLLLIEDSDKTKAENRVFNELLYSFLGTWESWLDQLPEYKEKNIPKVYQVLIIHVRSTCELAMYALYSGNIRALTHLSDSLLIWLDNLYVNEINSFIYEWKFELIRIGDYSKADSFSDFRRFERDTDYWGEQKTLHAQLISLLNLTKDCRIYLSLLIIKSNAQVSDKRKLLKSLIEDSTINRNAGISRSSYPIRSIVDLLLSHIRVEQRLYNHVNHHGSFFESLARKTSDKSLNDLIPGRFVSFVHRGGSSFDQRLLVEIGIYLSKSRQTKGILEECYIDFPLANLESLNELKSTIENWLAISSGIRNSDLLDSIPFNTQKQIFIDSITQIKNEIDKFIEAKKARLEIDPNKLKRSERNINDFLFEKGFKFFPINKFPKPTRNPVLPGARSLKLGHIKVARGLLSARLIGPEYGENRYDLEGISKGIQLEVFKSIALSSEVKEVKVDADCLVLFLKNQVRSSGCSFSVVLNDLEYLRVLRDENLGQIEPSRSEGNYFEYQFSLFGCSIYQAKSIRGDVNYIISDSVFESMSYFDFGSDSAVKLREISNCSETDRYELEIKNYIDCRLSKLSKIYKIRKGT